MVTLTTTIQEITLQAYAFGVFDILFNKQDKSRDVVLNIFEDWGREFAELEKKHYEEPDWFYYDEIDNFVLAKKAELTKENKTEWQALLDTANEDLLKKGHSLRITDDGFGFFTCEILDHTINKDGVSIAVYAENWYEEELLLLITDAWHYANTL